MIAQADIQALRERMPEYLEIVHGVTDTRKKFPVPWRLKDEHPSCKYISKTHTVIDAANGVAKDVFQLAAHDFGIERFPEQVEKVAEILKFGELSEDSTPIRKKTEKRPRFEAPADAGFEETPLLFFVDMMVTLQKSEHALDYLFGRGFSGEKIYQNVLGFVPRKECLTNDDGSQMFSIYEPNTPRGYITIPFPVDETFCTANYMMLRAIPGDKPPEHKELRPTGYKSPLYREWLLSAGCSVLYIVEGLLDCLALEMLIEKPCLALGGTPMRKRVGQVLNATPEHLRPKKIVLALDADEYGREAEEVIARDLEALRLPYSHLEMPEGCKDPCDALLILGDAYES